MGDHLAATSPSTGSCADVDERSAQPSLDGGRAGHRYWFTPKHHGYGAVPITWQGWMVMASMAIALPLVSVPLLMALPGPYEVAGVMVWACAVAFVMWAFLGFVRRRTDGPWLWRYNGVPYRTLLGIIPVAPTKVPGDPARDPTNRA